MGKVIVATLCLALITCAYGDMMRVRDSDDTAGLAESEVTSPRVDELSEHEKELLKYDSEDELLAKYRALKAAHHEQNPSDNETSSLDPNKVDVKMRRLEEGLESIRANVPSKDCSEGCQTETKPAEIVDRVGSADPETGTSTSAVVDDSDKSATTGSDDGAGVISPTGAEDDADDSEGSKLDTAEPESGKSSAVTAVVSASEDGDDVAHVDKTLDDDSDHLKEEKSLLKLKEQTVAEKDKAATLKVQEAKKLLKNAEKKTEAAQKALAQISAKDAHMKEEEQELDKKISEATKVTTLEKKKIAEADALKEKVGEMETELEATSEKSKAENEERHAEAALEQQKDEKNVAAAMKDAQNVKTRAEAVEKQAKTAEEKAAKEEEKATADEEEATKKEHQAEEKLVEATTKEKLADETKSEGDEEMRVADEKKKAASSALSKASSEVQSAKETESKAESESEHAKTMEEKAVKSEDAAEKTEKEAEKLEADAEDKETKDEKEEEKIKETQEHVQAEEEALKEKQHNAEEQANAAKKKLEDLKKEESKLKTEENEVEEEKKAVEKKESEVAEEKVETDKKKEEEAVKVAEEKRDEADEKEMVDKKAEEILQKEEEEKGKETEEVAAGDSEEAHEETSEGIHNVGDKKDEVEALVKDVDEETKSRAEERGTKQSLNDKLKALLAARTSDEKSGETKSDDTEVAIDGDATGGDSATGEGNAGDALVDRIKAAMESHPNGTAVVPSNGTEPTQVDIDAFQKKFSEAIKGIQSHNDELEMPSSHSEDIEQKCSVRLRMTIEAAKYVNEDKKIAGYGPMEKLVEKLTQARTDENKAREFVNDEIKEYERMGAHAAMITSIGVDLGNIVASIGPSWMEKNRGQQNIDRLSAEVDALVKEAEESKVSNPPKEKLKQDLSFAHEPNGVSEDVSVPVVAKLERSHEDEVPVQEEAHTAKTEVTGDDMQDDNTAVTNEDGAVERPAQTVKAVAKPSSDDEAKESEPAKDAGDDKNKSDDDNDDDDDAKDDDDKEESKNVEKEGGEKGSKPIDSNESSEKSAEAKNDEEIEKATAIPAQTSTANSNVGKMDNKGFSLRY